MKKRIALGCLFILLISCSPASEYKTVKIKNKYSLELPDFLSEVKGLNAEASLQYQNPLREFYVIVLDEPKTNFSNPEEANLEEYKNILKGNLETSLENPSFSPIKDTVINGLKAKIFSLADNTKDLDIYYKFAYIESKNHFYQIMTWTLSSRKDQFSDAMDTIIGSFKELESRGK